MDRTDILVLKFSQERTWFNRGSSHITYELMSDNSIKHTVVSHQSVCAFELSNPMGNGSDGQCSAIRQLRLQNALKRGQKATAWPCQPVTKGTYMKLSVQA